MDFTLNENWSRVLVVPVDTVVLINTSALQVRVVKEKIVVFSNEAPHFYHKLQTAMHIVNTTLWKSKKVKGGRLVICLEIYTRMSE
jgi:hypothetical protein